MLHNNVFLPDWTAMRPTGELYFRPDTEILGDYPVFVVTALSAIKYAKEVLSTRSSPIDRPVVRGFL